eukprot:COSAG01_NODE_7441_length_3211_cov_2.512853_3_plen_87_part_00
MPCGTIVRVFPAHYRRGVSSGGGGGEVIEPVRLLSLEREGQRMCIARGGVGGEGNIAFASGVHRSPSGWLLCPLHSSQAVGAGRTD